MYLAEHFDEYADTRRGYRIMLKENADGYQRMMCPAEGGQAQCPLKPRTLDRGIHLSRRLGARSGGPSPSGRRSKFFGG